MLSHWALVNYISHVALTALLLLLHGYFGTALGVSQAMLMRNLHGGIPRHATTIHTRAGRAFKQLRLNLLERVTVRLPDDDCLRGRGGRTVEGFRAPDLARNIAFKLMNPKLNNLVTPMYYQDDLRVPRGFACAGAIFSDADRASHAAALARADTTLAADIQAQIPGTVLVTGVQDSVAADAA